MKCDLLAEGARPALYAEPCHRVHCVTLSKPPRLSGYHRCKLDVQRSNTRKCSHVWQLCLMPCMQLQTGTWNKYHMSMHLFADHIKLNYLIVPYISVFQQSWETETACI